MKTKYKILLITFPAVFLLDQLTKFITLHSLQVGQRIAVIPGFFDIVHFRNTGAAFGLFSGLSDAVRAPFFYIIALIAAVVLGVMYRSLGEGERLVPFALSLVFGGIAGNVLDRVRLGEVVDFLSFHIGNRSFDRVIFGYRFHIPLEWPAFNVADMAITIAVGLIVISAIRSIEKGQ